LTSSEEAVLDKSKIWSVFYWCLPSLAGLALFLFSFPIDRVIPFWPHLEIAEIFLYWFVFVAPPATLIATVLPIKRRRRIAPLHKAMGWLAIVVSMLASAFVVLGMAG
jgi:hypothetical protein